MARDGTPRALGPIARQTLSLVAALRAADCAGCAAELIDDEAIRRIELCALATLDIAHFGELYVRLPSGRIDHIGGDPHAEAPEVQGQRSTPGGLPQAPEGGQGRADFFRGW